MHGWVKLSLAIAGPKNALIFREFSSASFDRHHLREQTFPVSKIPAQLVPRWLEYSFLVVLGNQ